MKKKIINLIAALIALAIFTATPASARTTTKKAGTKSFPKGSSVIGAKITLANGLVYENCKFSKAPLAGRVTDGVIAPWASELRKAKTCKTSVSQPAPAKASTPATPATTTAPVTTACTTVNCRMRQPTDGKTFTFEQNDAVYGAVITLGNGQEFRGCWFQTAPIRGMVLDGVINPWTNEVVNAPRCTTPVPQAPTTVPQTMVSIPGQPLTASPAPAQQQSQTQTIVVVVQATSPVTAPPTTAAPQCDTVDCKPRQSGSSLSFSSGDAIFGFKLSIGGTTYTDCYFSSAPGAGTVVDGVVHPWKQEVSGKRAC